MTAAPLLDTPTSTLTARALAAALRPITKVAKSRGLPVLAGVRLTSDGTTLCLRAFDYEISIHALLPGVYSGEPLDVLVDAKALAAFVAGDKTGTPMQLRAVADGLHVSYGATAITLHALPLEEFPTLPLPATDVAVHLSGAELARILKGAQASAGADGTLPVLTGVHLVLDADKFGVFTAASTDRYRLGWTELTMLPGDYHDSSFEALIPVSSLVIAVAACGPDGTVTIGKSEQGGLISIENETTTVTVRTLDGQFPKWRSLLPPPATTTITVDRKQLLAAVKSMAAAVAPAGRHGGPQLALVLRTGADGLTLSTMPSAEQQASSAITTGYTCEGDSIEWGFSPHYLLALLEAIEGPVLTIELTTPHKPFVLTGAGAFKALLMPVKLPA